MAAKASVSVYVPGAYPGRRSIRDDLISKYVTEWEMKKSAKAATQSAAQPVISPCITFSRKIGVGAMEIADQVAKALNLPVIDREVIEEIASRSHINAKAVAYFDERFPGYVNRTFKYLFGEKAFIDIDYARQLMNCVNAIAAVESTVIVGRGAHLILPRDRVLAVRCIGSDTFRIKRIAEMMGIEPAQAGKRLEEIDSEQAGFFKKVFGKKGSSPYEFDMVINLDHLPDSRLVADLVVTAFQRKFHDG